jgi:copper chaperone CopZ
MTCEHCVRHVKQEVSAITGVTEVDLTLEAGQLVVTSASPIALSVIEAAVAEAGEYAVTPA